MFTSKLSFPLSLLAFFSVAASTPAHALTNPPGLHDPSRMLESDGKLYVYATGGGANSSPDGLVWMGAGRLFPNGTPSSFTSVLPGAQGIWAPDGIYTNGQYYLYYSSANSSNACAIGVVTTPTLNPAASNYKLTDQGVVVSSTTSSTYCPIDPGPVLDQDNNLWLVWGGGYAYGANDNTIWVTKIDKATGLAAAGEPKPGYPLKTYHKEGPFLYLHAGNYFLWWQEGGAFANSTRPYSMHVARATTITGPYTGDRTFYPSNNGTLTGPGHMGIYASCGVERFTYHYYVNNTNPSLLGENELTWGADGWPTVGPESTTPIKLCGAMGGAYDGGVGGTGGSMNPGTPDGGSSGGPEAGSGSGAGGSAGSTATGGSDGTGTGGSQSTGGSAGSDGQSGSSGSGGTSPATTGGTGGQAGDAQAGTNTSGTAGEGTTPAPANSGCSCSVPGRSGHGDARSGLFAAAGAALIALRSRRRSQEARKARA